MRHFHFHAPSEHTVDGEHFPMEMHFVHQSADGALAVVGVLLEQGAANPGITPLWAQLPEAAGTVTTVQIPGFGCTLALTISTHPLSGAQRIRRFGPASLGN